jgi:hypothetical protein
VRPFKAIMEEALVINPSQQLFGQFVAHDEADVKRI